MHHLCVLWTIVAQSGASYKDQLACQLLLVKTFFESISNN